MSDDCIFCKIAEGKIPTTRLYDDGEVLVLRDIHPEAPEHLVIFPRRHISTLNDIKDSDQTLIGRLFLVGKQMAADLGIAESGYRTVMNCHRDAGQLVFHIHLHLLGGRKLNWPPG